MKKKGLILCTVISLFVLVASSVWEGVAGVVSGAELPATGFYIATNSFPLNTVVDVTNLETGRTIRVVTSVHLESTAGLLAVLSRDAADAIGLAGNSLGRIRMVQPPDVVAFYRFAQGDIWNEWPVVEPTPAPPVFVQPLPPPPVIVQPPVEPTPAPPVEPGDILVFVPAELRPPTEPDLIPDPVFIIPGIEPTPPALPREYLIDPSLIIEQVREFPQAFPPALLAPLPMIDRLQVGKYYLQIAAYSNADSVRYELSRLSSLDAALAREAVIMRAVNPELGIVYQILIGPLTRGESGALLHQFRSTTHRDAFIRSGS